MPCRRASSRIVPVTPILVQTPPKRSGKSGAPRRALPFRRNLRGHLRLYARRCLFIRWYGQRGEGTLPVSACWQQHPCVMVTPRAELSHSLTGSVHATVCSTGFRATDLSSAPENSISRSIHHEPRISAVAGLQGPPLVQAVFSIGRKDRFSRMSPSQRLLGPRPRCTLRITSVTALLAAAETWTPIRCAVMRLSSWREKRHCN